MFHAAYKSVVFVFLATLLTISISQDVRSLVFCILAYYCNIISSVLLFCATIPISVYSASKFASKLSLCATYTTYLVIRYLLVLFVLSANCTMWLFFSLDASNNIISLTSNYSAVMYSLIWCAFTCVCLCCNLVKVVLCTYSVWSFVSYLVLCCVWIQILFRLIRCIQLSIAPVFTHGMFELYSVTNVFISTFSFVCAGIGVFRYQVLLILIYCIL